MPLTTLVIDDDPAKAKSIADCILSVDGFTEPIIVGDVVAAKKQLQEITFDLVVIDIALPIRAQEEAKPFAGLELLKEILARAIYKRPKHFVGITALPEVYKDAAAEFGNELWSVIFYDRSSTEWLEQLQGKARHIAASESEQAKKGEYGFDLAVITALGDPELAAILNLNWAWKQLPSDSDATVYYEGRFRRKSGVEGTVVAAKASAMGMPAASILATKIGLKFRPRVLAMSGICAGNRSEVELGDVIAANPSWDYGSGKHTVRGRAEVFEPAPQPYSLSTRLRGSIERLQIDKSLLNSIREQWAGPKPNSVLRVHIGPLASGAAVLANASLFDEIKTKQNRKLLGVDMEGYGVMAAAAEVPAPQPEALVLKGVSDYADKEKNDAFRHYSAYTSARILQSLAEDYDV